MQIRLAQQTIPTGGVPVMTSSGLEIASVTAVLQHLLATGLAQVGATTQLGAEPTISMLPPDRIATGVGERPQLNLFLYRVTPQLSVSHVLSPTGARQLAVELHYLVSTYGREELQAEILLGEAIRILHHSSVIPRARASEILRALPAVGSGAEIPPTVTSLHAAAADVQADQWQVIAESLSHEDMLRLWMALQAPPRPSFTYRVVGAAIAMDDRSDATVRGLSS